jgi:hypothetical protein
MELHGVTSLGVNKAASAYGQRSKQTRTLNAVRQRHVDGIDPSSMLAENCVHAPLFFNRHRKTSIASQYRVREPVLDVSIQCAGAEYTVQGAVSQLCRTLNAEQLERTLGIEPVVPLVSRKAAASESRRRRWQRNGCTFSPCTSVSCNKVVFPRWSPLPVFRNPPMKTA